MIRNDRNSIGGFTNSIQRVELLESEVATQQRTNQGFVTENFRLRTETNASGYIEQGIRLNRLTAENQQLQADLSSLRDQLQTQNNYIEMMEEKLRNLQQ